jgi:hypothetical protein
LNSPNVKRLVTALAVAGLLALAPSASARVVELGSGAAAAKSNCPTNPCEVVGRVTGYQGRADTVKNPFQVGQDGVVVAFTVQLAKLEQNQIEFFTNLYGSPPQVRLSILRKGKRKKIRLDHRLIAESRAFQVERFFGSSPTFALPEPLRVRRGEIVALTIPTWAPAFARDLSRSNWWRSSRRKGDCDDVSQRSQFGLEGTVRVFGCTYHTARLLYTATFIPNPQPTDQAPPTPRR